MTLTFKSLILKLLIPRTRTVTLGPQAFCSDCSASPSSWTQHVSRAGAVEISAHRSHLAVPVEIHSVLAAHSQLVWAQRQSSVAGGEHIGSTTIAMHL